MGIMVKDSKGVITEHRVSTIDYTIEDAQGHHRVHVGGFTGELVNPSDIDAIKRDNLGKVIPPPFGTLIATHMTPKEIIGVLNDPKSPLRRLIEDARNNSEPKS